MVEPRGARRGDVDDVRAVVRNVRRRTLHGRKTRHGVTWAVALEASDKPDVALYCECGASLLLKAVYDSGAPGRLWWAWGPNA